MKLLAVFFLILLPSIANAKNPREDFLSLRRVLLSLPNNDPRVPSIANRMIRLQPNTSPSVLVLANRKINSIARLNQLLAVTINNLSNSQFSSVDLQEGKIIQSIESIAFAASNNPRLLRQTGFSSQELYQQIITNAIELVNSIPNVPNPGLIVTSIADKTPSTPLPTPVPYGA